LNHGRADALTGASTRSQNVVRRTTLLPDSNPPVRGQPLA